MLGQIVAFFAVATSLAFASTYGYSYPGYGGYFGGSVLGAGLYGNGLCGSRMLTTGCATPPFVAVGTPEVVASCGSSLVAPIASTGIMSSGIYGGGYYGSAYGLGRCGTGVIAAAY